MYVFHSKKCSCLGHRVCCICVISSLLFYLLHCSSSLVTLIHFLVLSSSLRILSYIIHIFSSFLFFLFYLFLSCPVLFPTLISSKLKMIKYGDNPIFGPHGFEGKIVHDYEEKKKVKNCLRELVIDCN